MLAGWQLFAPPTARAADGLPDTCRTDTELTVQVRFYPSPRSLHAAWLDAAKINTAQHLRIALRNGFATRVRKGAHEFHVLHVPVVRSRRDRQRIETLGHELLHAICGAWHPPRDDVR